MKNYAGFADGTSTIGQFTLKAGARYTQADRNSVNCNQGYLMGQPNSIDEFFARSWPSCSSGTLRRFPMVPALSSTKPIRSCGAFQGELDQHNVSWRTGLDWNPTDTLLAYFDVAKGYKAGSFPALSGSTDVAYTPVTQESVLTYEGGIKTQLLDRRLSLNLSAFHSDYKDKQIKSKLHRSDLRSAQCAGQHPEIRHQGRRGGNRVTSGYRPDTRRQPDLSRRQAGGSKRYRQPIWRSRATGAAIPIPYTSKWNAGTNVNYTFPLPGDAEAFVGGQATYRSGTTSSIGNEPVLQLPGYTLVDAQGGVDFAQGRYRVMLWGKNITNKFYLVNINATRMAFNASWACRPPTALPCHSDTETNRQRTNGTPGSIEIQHADLRRSLRMVY